MAEPLLDTILGKLADKENGTPAYEVLETYKGKDLEYREYEPLYACAAEAAAKQHKKAHFVVCDDYVSMSDGTGIVHIAPAFGEDDGRIGRNYDLPFVQFVDGKGNLTPETPYAGVFVKKADPMVLKDLDAEGKLYDAPKFEHEYPHCWRCDTPLIYYARESWFIKMTAVKEDLIRNNNTINWIPESIGKGRFGDWLENVQDWGISRNRYWGTPLNIWQCEDCGHMESIGSREELAEKSGNPDAKTVELHRPYIDAITLPCPKCGKTMHRVPEVIDCWFDSGAMPFAQHHYPFENKEVFEKQFPAQFISEAVDQTRGWFYSLLAESTILFNKAPYQNVIVLGHVQDENGQDIVSSVKVWVGPKVKSVNVTERMIATAGKNEVVLEGKCLENAMKVGLFDASGKLIDEKDTKGNAGTQKATLDVPSNIGGKADVTYTVKYAITDTYMDEPAGKIIVSNKIPATGVRLNKNSIVLSPNAREQLIAYLSPENSTDWLSWKSSQPAMAAVDQNGNVKAIAPGKLAITVTTESAKSASCNLLVGLRKGDVITNGIYRYKVTNTMVDGSGEVEVIGFVKGRSAKKVSIPKSVAWNGIKYNVTSVGTRAFIKNKKIRNIVIPDSVRKIRHKAFYACPNVKKLTIGKNVSFMGAHAFCLNKKLEKIVFRGTKLKQLRKPHVFIEVKHAKVYVPKRKYKAYKKMLSDYGLDRCKFVKK